MTQTALFGGTLGTKIGNIDIVSMQPDNTMLATAKTDGTGNATIDVFTGGSVTAIYRHTIDMGADLITWVGVKPGDVLTFGNRNPSSANQPNNSIGEQTYAWPALSNASTYRVWTACNDGLAGAPPDTSITMKEFSVCHRDPMTVLYGAFNASNTIINYGARSNITFAGGATITLPAWSTPVTGTINITGLPPEITSLSGAFRSVVDATVDFSPPVGYSGTPTGGAFTASFPIAQLGSRTLGMVRLNRPGSGSMQILDSFSLGTTTQTVATPVLPPWVQGRTTASAAQQMASWFLAPDAASVYDGQILHLSWIHAIGGDQHASQWDIILPPGPSSVTFPALPSPHSTALPANTDTLNALTRVFDIPSVKDYDALRAMSSANVMCLECSVRSGDFQRVTLTQL